MALRHKGIMKFLRFFLDLRSPAVGQEATRQKTVFLVRKGKRDPEVVTLPVLPAVPGSDVLSGSVLFCMFSLDPSKSFTLHQSESVEVHPHVMFAKLLSPCMPMSGL